MIGVATGVICAFSAGKSTVDYRQGKISGGALAVSLAVNAVGIGGVGVGGLAEQAVTILSGPYVAYSAGVGYLDAVDSAKPANRRRR